MQNDDIIPRTPTADAAPEPRVVESAPPPRQRVSPAIRVVGLVLVALTVALLVFVFTGRLSFFNLDFGARTTESVSTSQTFTVGANPTVNLSDTAGTITFQPGADGQVSVTATKRLTDVVVGDAQADLDAMHITFAMKGTTVTITGTIDSTAPTSGARAIDFVVLVPASATISVTAGAGNISVSGVTGNQQIAATAGNITLSDNRGVLQIDAKAGNVTLSNVTLAGASSLHVAAGNITGTGAVADGAKLTVTADAGNVQLTLPAATPAHLDASVRVGNLTITGWPVSVATQNLTGRVASGNLNADPTATITVTVTAGNITLTAS